MYIEEKAGYKHTRDTDRCILSIGPGWQQLHQWTSTTHRAGGGTSHSTISGKDTEYTDETDKLIIALLLFVHLCHEQLETELSLLL